MDNTIVLGLLGSLLVLQVVGIYLLLIRKRFKVTNGKVDLEKFLSELDEDVARGSKDIDKNIKSFISNIKSQNDKSEKHKKDIESTINDFVDALNNILKDVSKKSDDVIENIQNDSVRSKKEVENTIGSLAEALKSMIDVMKRDIEVMKDEVAALKKLTLDKDEKIKRYEEGYDQKNIKNFRQELFRILHFIEDKKDEEDSEALIEVHEDLELLLEDVGIDTINISTGDLYDGNEKIAAVKGVENTTDSDKDGIIFKKVRNGYSIQIADGSMKVLRPAEIIVYKYEEKKEEDISIEVVESVDTEKQLKVENNNTEGKWNE